jgi:hypothetical protein
MDIRYVVVHRPGPAWLPGVDFREQPGVGAHVAHYRQLYERGQLELGGPFLDPDGGGMMVTTAGVFEVRPWFVAMRR